MASVDIALNLIDNMSAKSKAIMKSTQSEAAKAMKATAKEAERLVKSEEREKVKQSKEAERLVKSEEREKIKQAKASEREAAKIVRAKEREESKAIKAVERTKAAAVKAETAKTTSAYREHFSLAKSAAMGAAVGIASYFSVGMVKALVAVGSVEEKLKGVLNVAFRGQSATDVWMSKIRRISSATGTDAELQAKRISQLREFGMKKEKDLIDTASAMADIDVLGGSSEAFIQARKSLRDMELQGKKMMSGQELEQMWRSTGLDPARIIQGLKEMKDFRGKSDAQLMMLLRQGTISTSQAEAAMRAAVQAATGKPLGGLAVKTAADGLDGIVVKLQNLWTESVIGSRDFKELGEVIKILLTGPIGEDLKRVVGAAAGILATFGKIVVYTIGGAVQVAVMLWDDLTKRIESGFELASVMYKIGENMVKSFLDALNLKGLTEAVVSKFKALPQSIRDVLGIHSPSKVFADIGKFSMEGFSQGFSANPIEIPDVSGSIQSPQVLPQTSSSSTATQTNNVTYNAHQQGDSYESFRRFLVRALHGVMEEAGIPVTS